MGEAEPDAAVAASAVATDYMHSQPLWEECTDHEKAPMLMGTLDSIAPLLDATEEQKALATSQTTWYNRGDDAPLGLEGHEHTSAASASRLLRHAVMAMGAALLVAYGMVLASMLRR
jgi:hypothetical protein